MAKLKKQYCDECEHFLDNEVMMSRGSFNVVCGRGYKPKFYKPNLKRTGLPGTNWGWKRRCADFSPRTEETTNEKKEMTIKSKNLTEEEETAEDLRGILRSYGFVPCDSPACNCRGWHPRYGLIERIHEIEEALAEAGHPLCKENGYLTINSLRELIAERDLLKERTLNKLRHDEEEK